MRIFEKTIDIPSFQTEIRLIPFGCVHADTDGFAPSLFRECIEEIAKPYTWGIPCGDYLDAVRTHAREALNSYRAKGEDQWESQDRWAEREYTEFYNKWLKPVRDKLFFIAQGNHHWPFANGSSSDHLLAKLCGVPYGDKPTFMRLRIRLGQTIIKTLKILVHHEGGGGGGYARHGTDVNAAETKLYQFGAFDIVIFSHTHRKWGMTIPDLDLPKRGALEVRERTRALIRTGCFTRSYDIKCLQHYAHRKLLPPTELGYVTLKLRFYRDYDAEKYADARRRGKDRISSRYNALTYIKTRMRVEH